MKNSIDKSEMQIPALFYVLISVEFSLILSSIDLKNMKRTILLVESGRSYLRMLHGN